MSFASRKMRWCVPVGTLLIEREQDPPEEIPATRLAAEVIDCEPFKRESGVGPFRPSAVFPQ